MLKLKIAAASGVVVAMLAGAFLWPGSQAKPAIAALTVNHECFLPGGQPSVVALGDSITEGHRFPTFNIGANDSYADVLSCTTGAPIPNYGVKGSTSNQILQRVDVILNGQQAPQTMLVLAGTNDVYVHQSVDDTVPSLDAIQDKLSAAGVKGVYGLLPPSNHHPELVMQVNDKIRAWAAMERVTLVDYWTPLADRDGTFKEGFDRDGDGLHPGPEAAHLMAEQVRSVLR